jgi:cysteine desulfurase
VKFQTAPHFPIYMDYSATTPIDPRVADMMIPLPARAVRQSGVAQPYVRLDGGEGGRGSTRPRGGTGGADPREIIWTSGATESNNLAIKGAAQFYKTKGKHIITVKTEHKAVLDTVRELERVGFEATYLEPQDNGLITIEQLKRRSVRTPSWYRSCWSITRSA